MTYQYELRKIFVHRKGILIVFLFCLLSIAVLSITDVPKDRPQDQAGEEYKYWIDLLCGPLDTSKEEMIQDTSKEISDANIALAELRNKYYAGEISFEQYDNQQQKIEAVLTNESGFNVIYNQYRYISENPENRYFVATNGWSGLLKQDISQTILFIVTLLILIVPIYCDEYSSEMHKIALSTQSGSYCFGFQKSFIALSIAVLLALWQIALKIIFLSFRYGLPNAEFPLQSLPDFSTCTKALTLGQATFCLIVSKVFGSILFAAVILFNSVCLKSTLLTAFISLSVGIIPFFALRENLFYRLPLPVSFMLGTGFFQGSEIVQNELGQDVYIFKELSLSTVGIVFLLAFLCMGIFLTIIRYKNSNIWNRK